MINNLSCTNHVNLISFQQSILRIYVLGRNDKKWEIMRGEVRGKEGGGGRGYEIERGARR